MRKTLLAVAILAALGCGTPPEKSVAAGTEYAEAEEAYRKGDYARVVTLTSAIVGERPEMAKPFFLRAKAYQAQGEWERAEADYTRAIETAPDRTRAIYLFWRGLYFSDRELHEKALFDLNRARELQLRFPSPRYYLEIHRATATARIALGQFGAAREACDFILSKDPDERTRREFEALKLEAIRGMRDAAR